MGNFDDITKSSSVSGYDSRTVELLLQKVKPTGSVVTNTWSRPLLVLRKPATRIRSFGCAEPV